MTRLGIWAALGTTGYDPSESKPGTTISHGGRIFLRESQPAEARCWAVAPSFPDGLCHVFSRDVPRGGVLLVDGRSLIESTERAA